MIQIYIFSLYIQFDFWGGEWIIPGWSKMYHPRMIKNLYIYYFYIYTVWLLGWKMDHHGMIQNGSPKDDPNLYVFLYIQFDFWGGEWIILGWSKMDHPRMIQNGSSKDDPNLYVFSIYTVWLLGWRMDHPGMIQNGSSQVDPCLLYTSDAADE